MNKGANNGYWGSIREGISSSLEGLRLTWRHFWDARRSRTPMGVSDPGYFAQETGIVTLQYPHEAIPVPDNGRYRLHNEMEDCIVCDKCAKICPVDCIDIEPIKAVGEVGKTSDGSSIRLYAARFDIDMAKCCFCGLCTTVCPTECLTMTKAYDFSEFAVENLNYHFANLSPAEADEKKRLLEEFQKEKAAAVAAAAVAAKPKSDPTKPASRPTVVSRPAIKPTPSTEAANADPTPEENSPPAPIEPKSEPVSTPIVETPGVETPGAETPGVEKPAVKRPVFRPSVKKPPTDPAK